jgi:hypothetical protein
VSLSLSSSAGSSAEGGALLIGSSLALPRGGTVVPTQQWSDPIAYQWPSLEMSVHVTVREAPLHLPPTHAPRVSSRSHAHNLSTLPSTSPFY